MLERLFRGFRGEAGATPAEDEDRTRLAAAALLVTAAAMDDIFDDAERVRIQELLARRFDLDEGAAHRLLAEAEALAIASVDLHGFTQTIKEGFDFDERLELLEMAWEVVYTDGVLHDHEANLLRRLAGLLAVSDRDSGEARRRVRARLNVD
jgi:uncharacterized tellurite resistance protein B-like protein